MPKPIGAVLGKFCILGGGQIMEAIEALIVSRAIEQTVFMLCAPLLLYFGYRLMVCGLDHSGQARAELRDKYKFQAAVFLPGVACLMLAVFIGFAVFSHPLELSKAEQDLLIKLDQISHPFPQSAVPAPPPDGPGAVGPGCKIAPVPKPS